MRRTSASNTSNRSLIKSRKSQPFSFYCYSSWLHVSSLCSPFSPIFALRSCSSVCFLACFGKHLRPAKTSADAELTIIEGTLLRMIMNDEGFLSRKSFRRLYRKKDEKSRWEAKSCNVVCIEPLIFPNLPSITRAFDAERLLIVTSVIRSPSLEMINQN